MLSTFWPWVVGRCLPFPVSLRLFCLIIQTEMTSVAPSHVLSSSVSLLARAGASNRSVVLTVQPPPGSLSAGDDSLATATWEREETSREFLLDCFYRPLCGGRSRSHFVSRQSVSRKTQMSHLETSNDDSAQSKHVWNENLEFLMGSAVCLLSADCLLNPK